MRNKQWLVLFLLSLISLTILTASCVKRAVENDSYLAEAADSQPDQGTQVIEEESLQDASRELQIAKEELETEDIYFDKKSYTLLPEAQEILLRKAEWLMQYPEINIIIQGHTDEPGRAEYNFALGDRRAGNVKSFLIQQGINPSRLTVVSFGRELPRETGESEESRAKNRRVHFVIE
ncbi:MAG: OmpA family protein [Deltaproteobacteria bacterium]|nr:MAG: OmpA family protein [Deltaproteobacteria bacterium]